MEIGAVQLGLQHVGLDHVHNLLPLRLLQREEVVPLRVLVADKAPVEPRQKVEHVDERAREVDEPHPAEPVLLVGLGRVERADRRADQVAGDAQQHQGDRVDPVVDAHRQFPHVDAPILDRMLCRAAGNHAALRQSPGVLIGITRTKPGEGAVPADRTDARRRPGTGQRNGWCE